MNNIYINKEGYLCLGYFYKKYEDGTTLESPHEIDGSIQKIKKYKVNKDGLFEEVFEEGYNKCSDDYNLR